MKIRPPADPEVPAMACGLERLASLARWLVSTPDVSLAAASALRTLERSGPCRLSELAAREGITQPPGSPS